jgi:hypothetical protein
VTRCLTDHGNNQTKWTAGHFVAVAMWSGGLEAGIQAAKAIRIFGIWSPHAERIRGKPPALSKSTDANDILKHIWPTRERRQSRLREWAEQYNPGTWFPDDETAHLHLLRQCIGPDLTQFPPVVRPKLKFGHGTSFPWKRLVTEEQFRGILAPVLRTHFDPEVDLDAIAEKIQPNTIDRYTKNVYEGRINSRWKQRLNLDDHYRPSRGNNKEINLPQTDDNEDDDEDFEERPKDTAGVKREPCSSKEISTNLVRDQLGITRQKYRDAEDSPTDDANEEQSLNAALTAVPRSAVHGVSTVRIHQPILARSPVQGSVNTATVQAKSSNLRTREEPQSVHQQVVNELYEQTCGISTHTIINFYESRNPLPALPNVWKEIWTHRQINSMWTSGSLDHLPYPRTFSTVSPRPKGTLNVHARIIQTTMDEELRKNAKADLSKFKTFCGEVIVID